MNILKRLSPSVVDSLHHRSCFSLLAAERSMLARPIQVDLFQLSVFRCSNASVSLTYAFSLHQSNPKDVLQCHPTATGRPRCREQLHVVGQMAPKPNAGCEMLLANPHHCVLCLLLAECQWVYAAAPAPAVTGSFLMLCRQTHTNDQRKSQCVNRLHCHVRLE